MNRHAAHYTLVGLLPQADAGEFANIGVVLACPAARFFNFRLIKRYVRVTRFFEEFAGKLFPQVRREVGAELAYLKQRVDDAGALPQSVMMSVMCDLARPRENMIRYAPLRTLMTDARARDLERLYERYVQRDGIDVQQRREELQARAVRGVLTRSNLGGVFVPEELGDEDFHVKFPFVHEVDGAAVAAIKPLDLAQDEPQKIYDHGGLWVQRFARLRRMRALPAGVLVPVERPPESDARRTKAYGELETELRALGVAVVPQRDAKAIVDFARRFAAGVT